MKKARIQYSLYILFCVCICFMSCIAQKQTPMNKKIKDTSTSDGIYTISAPIVLKGFVKKME